MNKTIFFAASAGALALTGVLVASLSAGERQPIPSVAAAERIGGVRDLVSARPFVLERPFVHVWRKEQPSFDAGWIVVLDVDPALVVPRQVAEPVLYFGDQTVERVNHGEEAGRVVAIVPSARAADGRPALDLASAAFYFGSEELPERIDARAARSELERAMRTGAAAFDAAKVAAATQRGGALLSLPSRDELDEVLGVLVLEHSPAENDLGNGLLAPRVR